MSDDYDTTPHGDDPRPLPGLDVPARIAPDECIVSRSLLRELREAVIEAAGVTGAIALMEGDKEADAKCKHFCDVLVHLDALLAAAPGDEGGTG